MDACDESEAVDGSQAPGSVPWSGERASEEGLQGSSRSSYCSRCSPPSPRPGPWSAEDVACSVFFRPHILLSEWGNMLPAGFVRVSAGNRWRIQVREFKESG